MDVADPEDCSKMDELVETILEEEKCEMESSQQHQCPTEKQGNKERGENDAEITVVVKLEPASVLEKKDCVSIVKRLKKKCSNAWRTNIRKTNKSSIITRGRKGQKQQIKTENVVTNVLKLLGCKECGKTFKTHFSLKSHQVAHSNARPFSCSKCSKAFKTRSTLRNHEFIHSDVTRYDCDHPGCAKTFKMSSHLKSHKFTHIEERAFVCTYEGCGKAYKTSANLKDHLQKHLNTNIVYMCNEEGCGKSFPHKRSLNRHKLRIHATRQVFLCQETDCDRVFKSKSTLKDHMRTHLEIKPVFTCDICFKNLGSVQTLNRHKKRVHSNDRKYICTTCGKSFKTNDNLKVHEFCHTGVRPYCCSVEGCGKSFVTRSNLKHHQYVHKGERPYTCKCGLSFRSLVKLKEHQATKLFHEPSSDNLA